MSVNLTGVAMLTERQSIEAQFNELVSHLDRLIDFYADDPKAASELNRLKLARDKAARGAELAHQLRRPWRFPDRH